MQAPLYDLILIFGKIGLVSLGGGNSMIKLIEDECVDGRAWLTAPEYAAMIGVTFTFPGLTAVKLAALIGYKVAGPLGLLASVASLNIPGIVLTVVFFQVIARYQNLPMVQRLMTGIQLGALILLAAALVSIGRPLLLQKMSLALAVLSLALFSAIVVFDISPVIGLGAFLLACMIVL
jgi:chromate transporter